MGRYDRGVKITDASGNDINVGNPLPTTGSGGGGGGGATTIADGADVAEGSTTDAAVTSDASGTVSAKLRGLVAILSSVWDSLNGRLKVDGSGVIQPISAASLPLPSGAATEATLAAIKTDVDKIPASPAQEHATAGSPSSVRLSDGTAFYKATTPSDTQPVSDGGGSLTVDGIVTANQGTAAAGSGAWPVTVTDTSDTAVKPGDAAHSAVRVNIVAGSAGSGQADNSTFTEESSAFTPVGGEYSSTPGSVTDGRAAAAQITQHRALHTNLRDATGAEIGTSGAPVRTDPTGTTTQPVSDGGGSLTVDGTVSISGNVTVVQATATNLKVDASGVPVPVTDNGGSLSVDDGGGSLTVDGTVSVSGTVTVDQVDTASLDYDTGAGTVNQTVVGIALPASGGPVAGGTATNPVRTDPTGTTTQPVSGTVTSNQGTAAAGSGAWPVAVTDTADTVVKAGDATNHAVRVNIVAGSAGSGQADNSTFTEGTTSFTPVGGEYNTSPGSVTSGRAAAAQITQHRALHTNLRDASGNEIGTAGAPVRTDPTGSTTQPVSDGGGSLTVDGTVAATQSGSWTVTANAGTGTFTVDQVDTASLDYDTGVGTVNQTVVGIALPASGGPVAGGTATNPVRTDPTGTTTQPVSGTVSVGNSPTVNQGTGGSSAWKVDGSAVTQPVSGTVTANAGSGTFTVSQTNLATADYDTGAGTQTEAMIGIALPANGGAVAGGTATNPIRTDPTGTTTQPVSIAGTVTISGTVTANQGGTWNVGLNTGSNTIGKVDQGAGGTSAWKVDGSAVTQPVSGTVTANAGSGTFTTSQTNAATADYDTGAGTVTEVMFGLALPANGGPVAGGTASNPVRTDPTGSTAQPVTDNGGSLTVDATSWPLPTGAATESTLGTLLTQSDFDTKVGSLTETAPASDTASSGLNGRLQRVAQRITSLIALFPTALTGSGNFKVSLQESNATQAVSNANLDAPLSGLLTQSDFDTKTGSLTETAPASDTASSGLNGRLQRVAQRLTTLIGLFPTALTGSGNFKVSLQESNATQAVSNANLDAPLSGLLTQSDFDTKTGSLTETAPASDTASSGLNGRLQRIAQRLTSLIALFPTSLSNGFFQVSIKETISLPVKGTTAAGSPITDAPVLIAGEFSGNNKLLHLNSAGGPVVEQGPAGTDAWATKTADGADVVQGTTTDAAVTGDNSGTHAAKLRGINKILANVWDSVNGWLKVSVQNTSIAVAGNKTTNNAVPTSDNIGVLPAVAGSVVAPLTDGNQVLLSTDLFGNLRVVDTTLKRAIQGLNATIHGAQQRSWIAVRNWAVSTGLNPMPASDGRRA